MAMSPTLRPARADDLPAIERLLEASSLPATGVRDALGGFTVAETNGTLVGVAGLEVCRENGLLRSVAVSPHWRSRGLGHALVTRVIADAEARGIRALFLLTTTAEKYFPSFGFARIDRVHVPEDIRETSEFQSVCPESAAVMIRAVRPGSPAAQ
jgi:amino-acid N-acetyltransferase